MRPADWTETASADNDVATATKAAATNGNRHVMLYVHASYTTAATTGLLTIKRGTTTVATHYVHGADVVPLELRGNANELVSAALAASGSGGVLGKVSIVGYSEAG